MDHQGLRAHMFTHVDSADKHYFTMYGNHKYSHNITQSLLLHIDEQSCPYAGCMKVFTNPKRRQDHVDYCPQTQTTRELSIVCFRIVTRNIPSQRTGMPT